MSFNRREFLKNSFLFAGVAYVAAKFQWVGLALAAQFRSPAPEKAADPKLPPASTNKYSHSHNEEYKGVRKPTFAKDARCSTCNYFKPVVAGDAWGKCAMIGNKFVYEDGLCQLWMKNPKAT